MMYQCGEGVEKNNQIAIQLYTSAVQKGNEDAKKHLAKLIEKLG
jgi:TPR repeat protein